MDKEILESRRGAEYNSESKASILQTTIFAKQNEREHETKKRQRQVERSMMCNISPISPIFRALRASCGCPPWPLALAWSP